MMLKYMSIALLFSSIICSAMEQQEGRVYASSSIGTHIVPSAPLLENDQPGASEHQECDVAHYEIDGLRLSLQANIQAAIDAAIRQHVALCPHAKKANKEQTNEAQLEAPCEQERKLLLLKKTALERRKVQAAQAEQQIAHLRNLVKKEWKKKSPKPKDGHQTSSWLALGRKENSSWYSLQNPQNQ